MVSNGLNASDRFQKSETSTPPASLLSRISTALKPKFAAQKTSDSNSTIALQSAILQANQRVAQIQQRIDREVQICRTRQRKINELNRWHSCETQPDLAELGRKAAVHIQALSQSQAKIRELEANKHLATTHRDELQGQLAVLSPKFLNLK